MEAGALLTGVPPRSRILRPPSLVASLSHSLFLPTSRMARVLSSPALLLSLVLLLIATLSTLAAAANATISVAQQQCVTCRDSGSCTTAYFGLTGKFCYDFTETPGDDAKSACCCEAADTCTASTTDCVCDVVTTPKRTPTPAPTPAPTKANSGSNTWLWVGLGAAMFVVAVAAGVGYYFCMKHQSKKAIAMLQDPQYSSTMTVHQQQQLQQIYVQHQYSPQQRGKRNDHAAL